MSYSLENDCIPADYIGIKSYLITEKTHAEIEKISIETV